MDTTTKPPAPAPVTTGHVVSADGTTIGYRRTGHGPAVILLHGGLQSGQNLVRLAEALAGSFDVIVPDRRPRGTGAGGEPADGAHAAREVEDLRALVDATGAHAVFGLSAGGLVALRAAREIPELTRLALYEPALSVGGSVPTAWLPVYDRQVAAGRIAAAMRTAMVGLRVAPAFFRLPSALVTPLLRLVMRFQRPAPGEVSTEDVVRAMHHDMTLVTELADTTGDYATVTADVLLLGGAKSPAYFDVTLATLAGVLPHVQRVTLSGMTHNDADNDGDPARVADLLEPFFQGAPAVQPRY
ncbi:alpha/beta fold hydrolase [Luteimicrobium sp. NPDC057192]|uniref:alpha/beta fold hydrolase n=1 Tax=Luteimicrobium sp. NPDC057192 TaxID=3346042 RepID=UPI003629FBD9